VIKSRVLVFVPLALFLMAPTVGVRYAHADDDAQAHVNSFRDAVNVAKIKLLGLNKKRGSEKTLGKREALELLSRAYIILQKIPAAVQEAEELGEARSFVENNLKDLGTDQQIKRLKDSTLLKAIQVYRAGNTEEALILFEELRGLDPTDRAVSFLVRHINKRLDDED